MSAVDPARRARSIGDLPAGQREGRGGGSRRCSRRRCTATYPDCRRRSTTMRTTIPTPTAGETVARAKRTERAEARRRYRAASRRPRRPTTRRRARGDRRRQARRRSRPASAAKRRPRRPPARIGLRRRLPAVVPADERPPGPRVAAVDRDPHQGALDPAADHLASTVLVVATSGNDAISASSCSRTSSRPRPSAASSSPASWHRGRAGCSASIVGFVSAICYSILVIVFPTIDPRCDRPADPDAAGRDVVISALDPVADHRRVLRGGRGLVSTLPVAVEPEPRQAPGEPDREGEAGRRPDADGVGPEGRRQALTASGR